MDQKAEPRAKRGLSLKAKFAGFVALLIVLLMGTVGSFVFWQQNTTLGREVRERGATIARSLAASSQEAIMSGNPLDLAVMVHETRQETQPPARRDPSWLAPLLAALPEAAADLAREAFAEPAAPVKNEGVAEAMIVGVDGTVLAHSDTAMNGQRYQAPAFMPPAPGDDYPTYLAGGRRLYDITEPIRDKITGRDLGTVHLGLDRGIIERTVRAAAVKLAAIAALGLAGGLVVSWLVVSWLVRPVRQLVRGVRAIAGGDFNQQVNVRTRDELGDLTRAFNRMANSLSEKHTLEQAFDRYVSTDAKEQVLSDPSNASIHSRRITATVYFSDIRGFTAMSETMQPEDVVAVINEYLGTQAIILGHAGGQVNKFVGDATMAVFGMREESPDDALNAVKAAVKVQAALKKFNEQRARHGQVAKQIGIGINTGEMVVGNIGGSEKMEYTAMGDEVTLADKLCAVCEGGSILITRSTWERVRDHVRAEALEPLAIAGRADPLQVYKVVGMQ